MNAHELTTQIKEHTKRLGFALIGIADTDVSAYAEYLQYWLQQNQLDFMHRHIEKRLSPEKLLPGTRSIICVGLPYSADCTDRPIAQFAQGNDYHKLIRKRLQQLANYIETLVGPFHYRAFADSAPVLEKPLAEKAGNGWIGKNKLLINKEFGSFLVLGELFTDLELMIDTPTQNHCGSCNKCIEACPTKALSKDNLDVERCIAYLTIEHHGDIPESLQKKMGNHVYGCDICQNVCPWNKTRCDHENSPLKSRDPFKTTDLNELLSWDEKTFLENTKGSDIRRLGYARWRRNLVIAVKNKQGT